MLLPGLVSPPLSRQAGLGFSFVFAELTAWFPYKHAHSAQLRPSFALSFGTFAYAKYKASLPSTICLRITRRHSLMTHLELDDFFKPWIPFSTGMTGKCIPTFFSKVLAPCLLIITSDFLPLVCLYPFEYRICLHKAGKTVCGNQQE